MSASKSPPPWRKLVNGVDQLITPRADAFVRTTFFADAMAAATRLEVRMRRHVEHQTSRVWHLWNLPTATDVRRVRAQLAVVEARLRDMSDRLDEREHAQD